MSQIQSEDAGSGSAEGRIDDLDPLEVEPTGDDSPAESLWRYIWRMSGKHQVCIGLLAVLVAILDLVPIELQRRIVDEALMETSFELLVLYGAIYLGVVVLHQAIKFGMQMYQGWISESAIRYTRRHLMGLYHQNKSKGGPDDGSAVAIVTNEVDKLGGFVGEGTVQLASNIALLIGASGYMLVVEPQIALFGLAFMVPQILLTPFLQRRLNRLVEVRVGYMRDLSGRVSGSDDDASKVREDIIPQLYRNRMRFFFVKFGLKALLNLLNALAPITVLLYGGYLVIEGHTTVGVIVAFLTGFQRVSTPIRQLIAFYRLAAQADVQHSMIARWMNDIRERTRKPT